MKVMRQLNEANDYLKESHYTDALARSALCAIVNVVQAHAERLGKPSLSILDLGCGLGGVSLPLSFLGHRLVACDIDAQSVAFCKEKNRFDNADYFTADIERVSLGETFDVVICSGVIEHSHTPERLLETVKAHIAPGGLGIGSVPNGWSFYEILFSRILGGLGVARLFHALPTPLYRAITGSESPYGSCNVGCEHVQFFTWRALTRLLERCGFHLLDAGNLGLGLFLDWKIFRPFKYLECLAADHLPLAAGGAWLFVVEPATPKQGGDPPCSG